MHLLSKRSVYIFPVPFLWIITDADYTSMQQQASIVIMKLYATHSCTFPVVAGGFRTRNSKFRNSNINTYYVWDVYTIVRKLLKSYMYLSCMCNNCNNCINHMITCLVNGQRLTTSLVPFLFISVVVRFQKPKRAINKCTLLLLYRAVYATCIDTYIYVFT